MKSSFARILAALPFAHAAICFTYLYFFDFGFGGNISSLASVSDIFSVGLSKVSALYLIIIFTNIIGFLWIHDDPLRVSGREEFAIHKSLRGRWFIYLVIALAVLGGISQIFYALLLGRLNLAMVFWPFMIPIGFLILEALEKNNLSRLYYLPVFVLVWALIQISTTAYSDGFKSRNKDYNYFRDNPSICEERNKLLFVRSEWLIIVNPDGARIAYSDDCKKKLEFPNMNVILDVY